jgi:hypothetical protein
MQNFGGNPSSRTTILSELSNGNAELGEAFAIILNDMVGQSGITNPKAEPFDMTSKSWRMLAAKPDKTPDDIKKLDEDILSSVRDLAESYLLFIAKQTRNLTGKIDYTQYEDYLLKYRFGRYQSENKPEYLQKVKVQIRNAFDKISACSISGDDKLIDKNDMAVYIYALAMKSKQDSSNKFVGFEMDGFIYPENYAVSEHNLFEKEDNLFSVKLRTAKKILNNEL